MALGQAGPWRKPSPLLSHCSGGVNLSGICWESGGPVLGRAVFTGCSVPCLSKDDIFTNQEDVVMIKQFLVEDERVRLICPSCPRFLPVFTKTEIRLQLKSMSLVVLARGCLETFLPRVVATLGFARCQRSANNKTEATSKIIKVSFLRTSTAL